MKGPKTYYMKDIWEHYALSLLQANPEWCGMTKPSNPIKNYYIYRKYIENGKPRVEEILSYETFRGVMETYFELAKEKIIAGECLDMTSGVGKIAPRRIQRNHGRKTINYARTKLQPKVWSEEHGREIRKKIIYYTNDDWCRIGWHKFAKIKNESVYEFSITRNNKEYCKNLSFNQQLNIALKANPLLKYKYIYYPLIIKTHDIPLDVHTISNS
jgi:hypothetical protein